MCPDSYVLLPGKTPRQPQVSPCPSSTTTQPHYPGLKSHVGKIPKDWIGDFLQRSLKYYGECPGEEAVVSKPRSGGIFHFLQPSGCLLCNCQGLGLEAACLTVSSLHRKWGGRQRARPGLPDTRPCQPHKPHRKKPSISETMAQENNNSLWLSAVVPLPHEIRSKGPHRTLYTVICLKISPKAPPPTPTPTCLTFPCFCKSLLTHKAPTKSKETIT